MRALFALSILTALVALAGCVPTEAPQTQRPMATAAVQMDPGRVTTSAVSNGQVTVAVAGHGQHTFTITELCSYVDMYVNDSGTLTVGRSGANLTIDGQVTPITCPARARSGNGGNNAWLEDTNPEGTYSPDRSGSGGADSENAEYNPNGEALGDQGINNQDGFAPPPNGTPDPAEAEADPDADEDPSPSPDPKPANPPANGSQEEPTNDFPTVSN